MIENLKEVRGTTEGEMEVLKGKKHTYAGYKEVEIIVYKPRTG